MSLYEKKEPKKEDNEGKGLTPKKTATIWLVLSVTVFLCSIVACLGLIIRSGQSSNEPTMELHIDDIHYVTEGSGAEDTTTESDAELTAPISVNDSAILNILTVGIDLDTMQTDTMMIISIDTTTAVPSMLSLPRDTYIAGDYDIPKLNRIYSENGDRGAAALKEAAENMLGFRFDKYVFFDDEALSQLVDSIGPIEFDVPSDPDYHVLTPGKQKLSDLDAFGLFRYNEEYTDVETEPYKVQRDFMAALLDTLLLDRENLLTNAELICQSANTDFAAQELAYLGELLESPCFASAFSRALPGGEISVDGEYFYQVDPESACNMLNERFNPLTDALTEYDVNFRQKQGASGEGEMPTWGFGGGTSGSSGTTESTDELPDEPTEETSNDSDELEPNEDPTEPTETMEPAPLEPIEPGGDE